MCGILLVKSKSSIPIEKHLQAFRMLESRGPDLSTYEYKNNIFIGQTVLHITGTQDYYYKSHKNFLAYNGEIYNYKLFGSYNNDIELVAEVVPNDLEKFKQFEGMWAWAWSDFNTVLYASDPQGEKVLYQYQDDDILIVCSEVTPILAYIRKEHQAVPYTNKCWTMLSQTPWKGITRVIPGTMYQDGDQGIVIDSIWSWISKPSDINLDEASEEFNSIWSDVSRLMTPDCKAGLSYSGGLDSNLILNSIPDLNLYAINIQGKDAIVDKITNFLSHDEIARLHTTTVDPTQWLVEYAEVINKTQMPAQSWSFVGKWLVSKHCQERVLFTGLGADELFGGYGIYPAMNYNQEKSHSPYSSDDHDSLWNQTLAAYHGQEQQATLLMDYWYQVVGVDAPGQDRISGAYGIEARNPFMNKRLMTFALNLPIELKINTLPKPLIRQAFLKRWSEELIYPKMGFAGHANDSFINFKSTGNRHTDWQQIAQKTFYDYTA
jgi:asparagine synthetase B (glutamine-hydrolysing)